MHSGPVTMFSHGLHNPQTRRFPLVPTTPGPLVSSTKLRSHLGRHWASHSSYFFSHIPVVSGMPVKQNHSLPWKMGLKPGSQVIWLGGSHLYEHQEAKIHWLEILAATWLETVLQGYSNQNSMVLVPKQRYRPMEQNKGLRGNATHLQPCDLWQTWQKQAMGKEFPVWWMMLGKLASHVQKAETEPLPDILAYNSLQMD